MLPTAHCVVITNLGHRRACKLWKFSKMNLKMKASLELSQSLTTLQSHTDFISHFLLPFFCHSWAKLMGSWLLPGLWFQASGISAWKAANESECHHMRLREMEKKAVDNHTLYPRLMQPEHPEQQCHTQRKHTWRLVSISTHIRTLSMAQDTARPLYTQLLCFPWEDCTPGGRTVQHTPTGPGRENKLYLRTLIQNLGININALSCVRNTCIRPVSRNKHI